ncbi:MAG: 50S ribosomal protein L25 [Phycisphaerales bacterium]|nr:50S ribosomal protein L25 [Phycisphaerales bacterium]
MEMGTISAEPRTLLGSKHTRRMRKNGKMPAIIYGHGEKPEPITIDAHEAENLLDHHSRVIELQLNGSKSSFLIKSVQYDYLGTNPIHLDLMRVNVNERIQVNVEIELRGTAKGTEEGGVVSQILNAVEVECILTNIPESIRASIAHLDINDDLLVKDLELPEGVTAVTDGEEQVAVCRVPTVVEETEEGEEGEAQAMPEVIGRAKDDEGSDDDK